MRAVVGALLALLAFIPVLVVAGGSDHPSGNDLMLVVHNIEYNITAKSTCTNPGTDTGAYSRTGYKFATTPITYKINQTTIPTNLSASSTVSAINTSFATWDNATSRALFSYGGTTTAKASTQDGTNTVGWGTTGNSVVATTYGWVDRKTGVLKEADIVFSTGYTWALNPTATGNCGGVAGAFDVRNLATHEAGHVVGLADLTTSSTDAQTMYGYAAMRELFRRDLANGDKAGLAAIFGP